MGAGGLSAVSYASSCWARLRGRKYQPPQPMRLIHHFACAGGTLISRSVRAQLCVRVLSEIDPLSEMSLVGDVRTFAPTDVIALARAASPNIRNSTLERMFLSALKVLSDDMINEGLILVLRDHNHSHYCTSLDPGSRNSLLSIVRREFDSKSIVTVRHPIDSWISLVANGWVQLSENSLNEYCRRYLLFLDDHVDVPILRYEDFVSDPDGKILYLCNVLNIPYSETWGTSLPGIKMSGDSGRTGDVISFRKRKLLDSATIDEANSSINYAHLCERLNYDPNVI